MKTIKLLGCIFLLSLYSHAQVGVGTTSPNATLDITASNVSSPTANDGILIPRIDNFPSTNPTADQNGMMVFVTGNGTPVKGFYYWDNGVNTWIKIDNETGWSLIGNSGTNSATNFIGTTDNESLVFRTNNTEKLRLTEKGQLEINNTGRSIFIGNNAGENDDLSLNDNTFVGNNSGFNNTTGANNSFLGSDSGLSNTTGINNTFVGSNSGSSNTTANNNSFFGLNSGELNTTGFDNSFFGSFSGSNNTNGRWNSFYGALAGSNNTTGNNNSFFGRNTGYQNTTGINNSFFGLSAGTDNTSGSNNVAVGLLALSYNVTGDSNVAIGYSAGLGATANSKSGGVFIGNEAGRNENNDNRLYIDNTATNSPLIYGEFDSNIVRINGELQVNNPTTTGYILPNTDGTVGQVMTTDGSGNVTFQDVVGDGDTQNTLDQAYDEGGAGAGKNITADNGAVSINGTDGILISGTLGSGNTIDDEITGDGVRMFFNPNKAAYRGGMAEDDWWIDSRIGNYTFSHGRKTWVAGDYSVAFGRETTANGEYAFAGGWDNDANGDRSFVYGFVSGTSGDYAVSFGNGNQASGLHGFTQGASNTASGDYTMAFGRFNSSTGDHSKAIGLSLNAESFGETVFGLYDSNYSANSTTAFDANDRLFVVGNGTSNTNRSNALTIFKNGNININDAYNIPNTDGTNGQVMTTDGAGNVTFEDLPTVTDTDTQNTLDEAYDEGGPGAGRTINALDGAVEIAGRDGFQVTGIYSLGNTVSLSGSGTRMFFSPRLSAFRAGSINGNQWDNANIGNYSIALGYNTTASGFYSTAFGEDAVASNNASTAFGSGTTASGSRSTAFGEDTIASATTSTAFGDTTTASGSTSTAFGSGTTASGNLSVAFGTNTVASGNYSTAFGLSNTAGSYGETAIGLYSNTGSTFASNSFNALDQLFVVGNGTSNSDRSNALTIYKSGRMNINDAYNMPTTDGTIGQVMTTDGAGNVTFENISAGDTDWVVQSTSNQASAVTDNLYTDGTVKIGGTNGATGGAKLEVINGNQASGLAVVNTSSTAGISIQNQNNVPNYDKTLLRNLSIVNNTGGTSSNLTGVLNDLSSNVNAGIITGVENNLTNGITAASAFYGFINETSTVNTLTSAYGMFNLFRHNSTNTYGVRNQHLLNGTNFYGISNEANGSLAYGAFNSLSASSSYGSFSDISGNGTGSKYGHYVNILSTAGGDHYGYYSDVRKSTGYAAYFVGRTSLGFYPTVNRYVMPLEDGTAGQVMTTNGAGDVTFQDLPTFTDTDQQDLGSSVVTANEEIEISITNGTNTTINIQDADASASNELITSAVLSGTDLEITEAGSTTTVNLSVLQDGVGAQQINDLTDGKSDNDGTQNGSSIYLGIDSGGNDDETNNQNVGIGFQSLRSNTSGQNNTAIGHNTMFANTSGNDNVAIGQNTLAVCSTESNDVAIGSSTLQIKTVGNGNVAIGYSAGRNDVTSSFNTYIGYQAGGASLTSSIAENKVGNIFLGYNAGFDENGSNKLYIENSDSSTPLIYGEFDNDILRANGELQVGDPTTTGFAFPTADGTNGQVMTTDGFGVVSFQDLPTFTDTDEQDIQNLSLDASNILTVGIENGASDTVDLSGLKDADWYEVGTTNSPDSITDNIFTEGNVGIGTSTIGAHTTSSQTLTIGPNDTTSSVDASYIELVGLATPNQTVAGIHFDSGTPTGDGIARIEARLNSSTQFAGHLLFLTGNSSGNLTEKMRIEDNGDIGIGITNPDTRLHVSGDFKLQNGSEAIGRVLSTNNQGLSSWVDPATVFTDTDDQDLGSSIVTPNEAVEISITNGSNTTINIQDGDANASNELITAAVLNGTDLEITEAGSTTSVDLSSLNPVKSVARITMSASQTETGAGTTKVNFDTVDFDVNSNFNTTADRFVVPVDGLYRVTSQITMDASTGTGIFAIRIRVNGTQERRSEFNHHGNGQVVRQVTSILNLTAGQTLDVSFSHPSIGATILANGRGTFFEIEQL